MNLILLGMPGAGKGTQAEHLQKKFSLANVSTGAILRDVSKSNSQQAEKVRQFLDSGKLVPNEIIIEMLVNRINEKDCVNGFILDGFPRNLEQATSLDDASVNIDRVIFLRISEDEIVSRMSGRRVHLASGRSYHVIHNPPKIDGKDDITGEELVQRDDDKPEVIKKRVEVYFRETEPLLKFYKNSQINFNEIDASKPLKIVTSKILEALS
ncbi:MAG: adenylate kinase [Flavobacteriaceae bacterium]|nr:adenylate kinase [Flavobacteriaceae bacterium]